MESLDIPFALVEQKTHFYDFRRSSCTEMYFNIDYN